MTMKRLQETVSTRNKRARKAESYQKLGIIESICLRNFMCHDHLKFNFDQHINFIIGQNGSGKSAILTGIILALGGKSSTTGRYSNIKGFVKTGKQRAHISVTLRNEGEFAYKPELYGEKVIVEREISVDGASSYKLKSEGGRIISTLKEELTNILNAMDIQIENPVLILTQETSRNFLMSKTGKEEKLYEFFYKGTGLQLLEENYQHAKSLLDDGARELLAKEAALPGMRKEVDRLKKLKESTSRVQELRNELIWANISNMEKMSEEKSKELCESQAKCLSLQQKIDKLQKAYDEACAELEKHLKEKADNDEKITIERKALMDLAALKDQLAKEVCKNEGSLSLHKREERKLMEDVQVIEKSIQENQMQDKSDFENQKRQSDHEIQVLEEKISNNQSVQEQLKKDSTRLTQEQTALQHTIDSLRAEINQFEYKKNSLTKDLLQLNQASKNRQFLFGEHTPAVLAEIKQREREFIKQPKGPIGLDIEVKDQRWNKAIEACIKPNILCSFCCDNARDSTVLTNILKKYYPNRMPSIIVSKYLQSVHDVSQYKAQSQFPTVLDMLKIRDPVIANCLIDQLNIESKILIEDIQTAQDVMLYHPPRNCYAAFLMNCDEILLSPYRHYSASARSSNSLLQTVDENYINSVTQKLRQCNEEIKTRESKINNLQSQFQMNLYEIEKREKQIVRLTSENSQYKRTVADLKQISAPKDIPEMCDEYTALTTELAKKKEEKRNAEEICETNKAKYQDIEAKLHEQKALVLDMKNRFHESGTNINEYGKRKEVLDVKKSELIVTLKNEDSRKRRLEAKCNEDKKAIQEVLNKAPSGPRVMTDRSLEEISSQLEEMEKVIQVSSKCNRTDLLQKYREKSEKLKQAETDLKTIGKYNKRVDNMLKMREKKNKEIKKFTQQTIDLEFAVVLKGNGYTGRLDFSKPNCLRLEASPRQENPEKSGQKKCSSLSGGERSFVTISFLLALWQRIKMPFRILDEYDVFMDSNNRHLSINLLLRRANIMKNVQFIFLSPLELPEMKEADHIKIHKMPAPKRIGLSSMEE